MAFTRRTQRAAYGGYSGGNRMSAQEQADAKLHFTTVLLKGWFCVILEAVCIVLTFIYIYICVCVCMYVYIAPLDLFPTSTSDSFLFPDVMAF